MAASGAASGTAPGTASGTASGAASGAAPGSASGDASGSASESASGTASGRMPMIDPSSIPVRFSNLKQFSRSPAHYLHAITSEREETPAMILGSAVHALVLQPEHLEVHGDDRRSKEYRDAKKRLADDIPVFTEREIRMAMPIASSVLGNRLAMEALSGVRERRILWEIGPRQCSSTPDAYNEERNQIGDLKVCFTSEPSEFIKHAESMFYHAQLSFYRRATNMRDAICRIVVVEKTAPYLVSLINLGSAKLEQGDMLCRGWFERLITCEASGKFPGYCEDIYEWE